MSRWWSWRGARRTTDRSASSTRSSYGIEIHLPSWAPPEAAQVKLLTSFDPDDPTLRGTVVYPVAFDGLE